MKKANRIRLAAVFMAIILIVLSGCNTSSPGNTTTPGSTATTPGNTASTPPAQQTGEPSPSPLNLPNTPQMIGTHSTGSLFYLIGSGIASIVTSHTGMRSMVQPYSGPSAWMPDLDSGAISFGIINYTEATWTYLANQEGVPTTSKIRQVMRGHRMTNIAWITSENSAIEKLSDLKGKTVAGGYGGTLNSFALVTAGLASVGLTWDDVQVVPVADVNSGLELLGDNTVVACHGGTATSANTVELNQRLKLQILPFGELKPEDLANGVPDWCKEILDKYVPGTTLVVQQPVGIQTEPAVVYSYPLMLASSTNVSADVVYSVLKACYENNSELVEIDKWLNDWKADNMFDPEFTIPYHDGAVRFYKEIGVWDDAAQTRQDSILEEMGEK